MPKSAAIYATQGGGKVIYSSGDGRYVFIESPQKFPYLRPGDFMPEDWGTTGPINLKDCTRNAYADEMAVTNDVTGQKHEDSFYDL